MLKPPKKTVNDQTIFYFGNLITKETVEKIEKMLRGEELYDAVVFKTVIKNDETTCICYDYFKDYVCLHTLVAKAVIKKITIPNSAKVVKFQQKPKRGRKSLALPALVRQ